MRWHPAVRAVTVLGLAAAGLIGGHALGYAIAVPQDVHRTVLLDATGHGYWPSASRMAVILGIAAVVAGVMSGYMHRSPRRDDAWRSMAWRMSLLQCAGFVALEVIERAMASASMTTLSIGVLVIGLVAQVAIACVLALLVAGLRRVGGALRCDAPALRVVAIGRRTIDDREVVPASRAPLRDRVRGPPLLAA